MKTSGLNIVKDVVKFLKDKGYNVEFYKKCSCLACESFYTKASVHDAHPVSIKEFQKPFWIILDINAAGEVIFVEILDTIPKQA